MTIERTITRADLTDASEVPDPSYTTRRIAHVNHYGSAAPAKPAHTPKDKPKRKYAYPLGVYTPAPNSQDAWFNRGKIVYRCEDGDFIAQAVSESAAQTFVNEHNRKAYDIGRRTASERNQAREQVKTLTAACKDVADLDLAAVDCGMIPTEVWKCIHANMRAVVASVESEQAK